MSGQAMAMVRGLPMAVGYMELCAGHAMLVVAIDSDGQPTHDPSHNCPECLLAALDLADSNSDAVVLPLERPEHAPDALAPQLIRFALIFKQPRAPPALV